ncbi:MAG: hypothetical protein KAJ48_01415 [Elusimicrobiales bacterium]|nr:hypothetical protein [Elusimicrobiales bacterium]
MTSDKLTQYRPAIKEDALNLARFYKSIHKPAKIVALPTSKEIQSLIENETAFYFMAENKSDIIAIISIMPEKEHGLAKIHQMIISPAEKNQEKIFLKLLNFTVDYIEKNLKAIDMLYCTTRTLKSRQQELTINAGFKILGIFPKTMPSLPFEISGLTAYYFHDALSIRRNDNIKLHPVIKPFFAIAGKECGLKALPLGKISSESEPNFDLPILEIIQAPHFVSRKFNILKEQKMLSVNFYPFQKPNTLITDPDQKIEIFVNIIEELNFATIIGERLKTQVNPVKLYKEIANILQKKNITYIEVINDAGDIQGIDCILKAGYLPCVYFPSLKNHGNKKRDYVIFAKSSEINGTVKTKINNKIFTKYVKEFKKLI